MAFRSVGRQEHRGKKVGHEASHRVVGGHSQTKEPVCRKRCVGILMNHEKFSVRLGEVR
ncbi:hypothetical protein RRSWK_03635 [Rhodopirellula sp. SWK7]|nr:hypothetical protein RRSWK_03635 [Rhodopirellula sp. SWK7]